MTHMTNAQNELPTSKAITCYNLPHADRATIDMLQPHVVAFAKFGTPLPEELADLFSVTIYEAEDGRRAVVGWA